MYERATVARQGGIVDVGRSFEADGASDTTALTSLVS